MKKKEFINLARKIYGDGFIPLHRPIFGGNERKYLIECIDSNFVSSVGKRVDEFEEKIAEYTGSQYAVAVVNGTSALHVALKLAGVNNGDEVISQALTFIATCNAISYTGSNPVFVDVDLDTMGMSPKSLKSFLEKNCILKNGNTYNKISGKKISACVPMHTFGFPCRIIEISKICSEWGIKLIEDAAESLGSFVNKTHTGRFGLLGTFSFNGNKVITTGGGGMIITDNKDIAQKAKHITTTSKIPHPYKFVHDEVGFNYRMPNLNAALGCAQLERIEESLSLKKDVASIWASFFDAQKINFVTNKIEGASANHWLNVIILSSKKERDEFLEYTNSHDVMTRPIWELMTNLEMFKHCQHDGLKNSKWLSERIVNIPSSAPDKRPNQL